MNGKSEIKSKSCKSYHVVEDSSCVNFYDCSGSAVTLSEPREISASRVENYKEWIASITEWIGEALHDALPVRQFLSLFVLQFFKFPHVTSHFPEFRNSR